MQVTLLLKIMTFAVCDSIIESNKLHASLEIMYIGLADDVLVGQVNTKAKRCTRSQHSGIPEEEERQELRLDDLITCTYCVL